MGFSFGLTIWKFKANRGRLVTSAYERTRNVWLGNGQAWDSSV